MGEESVFGGEDLHEDLLWLSKQVGKTAQVKLYRRRRYENVNITISGVSHFQSDDQPEPTINAFCSAPGIKPFWIKFSRLLHP